MLNYFGIVKPNDFTSKRFDVKGIDVSMHQGKIDWQIIEEQDISFAFIKATEGSDYIDPFFEYNDENANRTSLRIGAYHYFTFSSSGKAQAQNFISVVPFRPNMLPPVIDIEFDSAKATNALKDSIVIEELSDMLQELEKYYGLKPILYSTVSAYYSYIRGNFDYYDLWIRNVYCEPIFFGITEWTFWQYSDTGKFEGYDGVEQYIDLNVFSGNAIDFFGYP